MAGMVKDSLKNVQKTVNGLVRQLLRKRKRWQESKDRGSAGTSEDMLLEDVAGAQILDRLVKLNANHETLAPDINDAVFADKRR